MKTITPGHKYKLENFEPNPPHMPAVVVDGPLSKPAYELCLLIENLPASEASTSLTIAAGRLLTSAQIFESKGGDQVIQFIEKVPIYDCAPGQDPVPTALTTKNNGTTNEEVLAMLIDRMNYLQAKFPCRENALVITKLEESLMWLNKRTADRLARGVEGKHAK